MKASEVKECPLDQKNIPGKNTSDKQILRRSFSAGAASRYPLINEGDVQVCRINHHRTLLQKIIYSRPLRRWESHHIILADNHLHSHTPRGYMTYGLAYNEIQEVVKSTRNGSLQYAIHLIIPRFGSLLIQVNNSYSRDQWFNSLVWKITACRFRKLFSKIKTPAELTHELQELIHFCMTNPITDPIVFQMPLNSVSSLLLHHGHEIKDDLRTEIIKIISPILEMTALTPSMCKCFQRIIKHHPHVEVGELLLPPVYRVLKHNTDFGKAPSLRVFAQDYLCYVYSRDESGEGINELVQDLHTANETCPHMRVLPNLVTVSLAAIYSVYEEDEMAEEDKLNITDCFKVVFESLCKFSDWIPHLAAILQAVPFPTKALEDPYFNSVLGHMVKTFAMDKRCEVHQCILPIREEKNGWIHLFGPGGVCCHDDGKLFSTLMSYLVPCCYKRKRVLATIKNNMKSLFTLMAIRDDKYCIEALISLLNFELLGTEDESLEIVAALQSSSEGRKQYEELCLQRTKFIEMRQSGGPYKLTLPSQSTDEDLIQLLKSDSFGNLRSLNLAFTRVTSESAKYIIQLPSLLHLNLWGTPFDDDGLLLISENLQNLQSLNLCETSITDEGLNALILLENLRVLNLNSTKLSELTYEYLKKNLTNLQLVDICYTDAFW